MRHILSLWFSAILCLIPLSSNAEENVQNLPVLCDTAQEILSTLKKNGLELKFIAENHTNNGMEVYTTVWVNKKTEAWAVVATDKEASESCLLVYGIGYMQYFIEGTML